MGREQSSSGQAEGKVEGVNVQNKKAQGEAKKHPQEEKYV